jgi:hypothetical protein
MLRMAHAAGLLVLVAAWPHPTAAYFFSQLPPPPIELEANKVFHEAFIAVMQRESDGWQLQPARSRGPAPSGRPPFAHEEMTWRRSNGSYVSVRYSRYSSSEAAAAALAWERAIISVGTYAVKVRVNPGDPPSTLADEAYMPVGGSMLLRRGQFVFRVSTDKGVQRRDFRNVPFVVVSNGEALMSHDYPLARLSALFVADADRVLADAPAR